MLRLFPTNLIRIAEHRIKCRCRYAPRVHSTFESQPLRRHQLDSSRSRRHCGVNDSIHTLSRLSTMVKRLDDGTA